MCALQHKVTEEQFSDLLIEESKRKDLIQLFLDTLGPEGQDWLLVRVLQKQKPPSSKHVAFAKQIGITQLDPDQQQVLETTSLLNYFRHRKQLLAQSLTAQEVAKMLGVSKQTVHERIKDGKLIGLLENSVMKLPTFQFDPEGPNGIIDGLPEIFSSMSCSLLGKINWMIAPNAIFKGKSPLQALRAGKREWVLQEAQAVGVA